MKIMDWMRMKMPGDYVEFPDRIDFFHFSGDRSTLWKNTGRTVGSVALGDAYLSFDGMDLFSSTFKFFSLSEERKLGGVTVVDTVQSLKVEMASIAIPYSVNDIPFMYQAGIGYYVFSPDNEIIYEWDQEACEITEEYLSIFDVLDEWISAVT